MTVYEGWDGYQLSIAHAVAPLKPEQLEYRLSPKQRSVGELVRHISLGRLTWFAHIDAPGSRELAQQVAVWDTDSDGNRYVHEDAIKITSDAAALIHWLDGRGP